MAKLLLLALFATTSLAFDLDWSKFKSLDIKVNSSRGIPGFRHIDPTYSGRITGGNEAPPNAFPYQVGLFLSLGDDLWSFCGGSVISDEWILTAAHCTDEALLVQVHLGAHNIRDTNEDREVIIVERDGIILHENWDRSKLLNDISLLKLPKRITFNKKVQPIALPRQVDISSSYEGEPAVASGWGKDSDEATTISPSLRYIETDIFSLAVCRILFFFVPTSSNICISGQEGKSTCNGDSGGPLVVYEADGTPILVGATSFGSGFGCEMGMPAVFSRVTSYLLWIHEHTGIKLR